MLEQFQNVLQEQPHTQQDIYFHTRNLIFNAIENLFPPQHNFEGLASICEDPHVASNPALLTYHLVDYFTQLVQLNFVSVHNYEALQSQTQKLEATIRSHIRLQQQVKMYLQHLQSKVAKYETYLRHQAKNINKYFPLESNSDQQETKLRRQRISLIRKNEHLKRQLQERDFLLKKMSEDRDNDLNSKSKKKLLISRSQQKFEGTEKTQNSIKVTESKEVVKTESLQKQRIMINISGNNNEIKYYVK